MNIKSFSSMVFILAQVTRPIVHSSLPSVQRWRSSQKPNEEQNQSARQSLDHANPQVLSMCHQPYQLSVEVNIKSFRYHCSSRHLSLNPSLSRTSQEWPRMCTQTAPSIAGDVDNKPFGSSKPCEQQERDKTHDKRHGIGSDVDVNLVRTHGDVM